MSRFVVRTQETRQMEYWVDAETEEEAVKVITDIASGEDHGAVLQTEHAVDCHGSGDVLVTETKSVKEY